MRIIIVGKAASGKDYLKKKFIKKGLTGSISYTTRPQREGEINAIDYNFVKDDYFDSLKFIDYFYENNSFNGWQYGVSHSEWNSKNIFIMTPSGIKCIRPEDRKSCFIIYLDVPFYERQERLLQRSDADSVDRRMKADEEDFKLFKDFDLRITNYDF